MHELKSGTVYPVAVTQDGASVSWIVTASDTATVGAGRAELRWYVGDTLAKSAKFRTSVSSALADTTTETPPAPQKSWVDKVLAAAQEIKDGAISDEKLAAAIAAYLEEHPIDAGLDEAELAAYLTENGYLTDAALADAVAQALADAKSSGEFNGDPGMDGADGSPGADGADGVGIQSVVQTTTSTEDGGTNIVTVTKTDGTTSTFQVKNGSKGSDGVPGADGKDGADGQNGADGVTPNIQIGAVETLLAGNNATASITGTTENPILNLGIPKGESVTDEQVRSAVDNYVSEHGLATGATAAEAAQIEKNTKDITNLKSDLTQLDDRVQTIEVEGGKEDYRPNYFTDDFKITEGIRINNGVESSNKSYFATDFLPIDGIISFADFYTPLYMNGIFFYDASKTYIGKASVNDIPESAKYYRISDQIIGWKSLYTTYGNVAGYGLNRYYRQLPKENGGIALANNVNLVDVISDPTKPTVTINFYGDSNTYGYGVEQKSWAYYIAQGIKANFTGEYKYYVGHPHVQAFCNMNTQASPYPALKGLTNQNIEDLPYIRIRTTATSVKVGWNGTGDGNLVIDGNYYDVRPVSNGDTVSLDGALHVLDLKPSVANVMNYNPYFAISKTIACNNYGVAGRSSQNQDITGLNTCDIAFMMIGTNDGNNSVWEGVQNSVLLQGVVNPSKLIGILPPANRANATLMRQIAHMKMLYDVLGVRYVRIPYFNELISIDSTLMQSDGLHYTAKGHMALANAISSECGACVNVWDGAEYSTTVSDTFLNL